MKWSRNHARCLWRSEDGRTITDIDLASMEQFAAELALQVLREASA